MLRAIISVSNKQGLGEFARALADCGLEIYSTGGTRRHLESAGVPVRDVAAYTGFPEMMDGRVKTLHPKIFAGILCRRDNPDDMAALAEHGILTFDLVVVNLYPFQETVAKPGVAFEEAIEQIDIGGPSLVRAAAKNHAFTTIVTDPSQYERVLAEIRATKSVSPELRRELAQTAFAHVAKYDLAIAVWLASQTGAWYPPRPPAASPPLPLPPSPPVSQAGENHKGGAFPQRLDLHLAKLGDLRYGENPHQAAAVYAQSEATAATLVRAEKLHGKELSYNNLLDLDSALSAVRDWPAPCVVVIKHNNPCGAATDGVLSVATRKALDGDPTSAFGSVLGFNRPLDAATAEVLAEPGRFVEAIVAPDYDAAAIAVLTTRPAWKNSVRLLRLKPMGASAAAWQCRPVDGGFLVQEPDIELPDETKWHVATALRPAEGLWPDLRFAWRMVRYAKSNAIVVAREGSLIGVGAGQMSRVDSVKIALEKAGGRARGSVLASDAFFPFADSIELAAASGIAAIIQPGGSKRDAEVIEACNRHKLAMIFTGTRHFRH